MYEKIPEELKKLKQWVCWCGDKLPKNPHTGGNARSNDPKTWGTFQEAIKAKDKYDFDGIGFEFAPPYFGVDLDKCIDKTDFIDEFVDGLQSYNELSKSGQGIHIICKGVLPEGGRRKGNVEMYSEGRYFIMTGRPYNESYLTIEDCTEKIKPLHAKWIPKTQPAGIPKPIEKLSLNDEEIIERARASKSGSLFQLLYQGEWQGLYNSQSEADMAFCNLLAFWTQRDKSQMDRIFRQSGLMRAKWDRSQSGTTYGNITLDKAILSCKEVYQPHMTDKDISLVNGIFGKQEPEQGMLSNGIEFDMTDSGNAERFVCKFGGNVKYLHARKKWYYWTGKKWQTDETARIKQLADMVCEDLKREALSCEDEKTLEKKLAFAKRTANTNGKNAMLTEAQHLEGVPIVPEELDAYDMYLNTQNGIVSLRNGEVFPHEPSFMMTKITTAEISTESSAKASKWYAFLDDVTAGDKELQRYLQKCVGYSLSGDTSEQCLFFLYGMGNNGKSTFLDTIARILGDYAANAQPETLMIRKQEGIGSDLARLKSVRLVTCEEPTEGVRLNEGLVKQLTGGGKVTCRFLYGDEFEYEPEFKIWICTNHKPVIRGTDAGIWRRIRMIPFEVSIPQEKIDKNLKFKLLDEYPLILKWALEGCILWQREGLDMPEKVKTATDEYKSEMDMLQTFVENCVEISNLPYDTISATELYNAYRAWAKENGEFEMTSRRFGMEVIKKLPDKKRTGSGIVYTGIKLINAHNSNYGGYWHENE